jgi:uncharacterized membrane protein YwzB
MDIVHILVVTVVVAFVYWLLQFINFAEPFKKIMNGLMVLFYVAWLLIQFFPSLAHQIPFHF